MGSCRSVPAVSANASSGRAPSVMDRRCKILLLGTSDSGKSTVFSQITDLFGRNDAAVKEFEMTPDAGEWHDSRKRLFREILSNNLRDTIATLGRQVDMSLEDETARQDWAFLQSDEFCYSDTWTAFDDRGSADDHMRAVVQCEESRARSSSWRLPPQPEQEKLFADQIKLSEEWKNADCSVRAMNPRTLYGVYVAPACAPSAYGTPDSIVSLTTGMTDDFAALRRSIADFKTVRSWRSDLTRRLAHPNERAPKAPTHGQPDLSLCCDNVTLRKVLAAIFTGSVCASQPGDTIVLPHLVSELLPIIADYATASIAIILQRMWLLPSFQSVYARRHALNVTVSHNAVWCFERLHAMNRAGYLPSADDIARARQRTTGIRIHPFDAYRLPYTLWDVGGQRNERKRWLYSFEHSRVVWHFVALSEYDQMLYEDETKNRLIEAFDLYEEVFRTRWFPRVLTVLVFTKIDTFRDKLKSVPLSACYPDYGGDNSYDDALQFIQKKFLSVPQQPPDRPPPACIAINALARDDVSRLVQLTGELLTKNVSNPLYPPPLPSLTPDINVEYNDCSD